MVYSCSWPAYLNESAKALIYPELQQICNLWRQFDDIQNSWDSMLSIVDYWGDNQDVFAKYAGPGSWNDPDMLIIGASSLSQSESEVQMGMWAIFAAPLIMGNDLRKVTQWQRDILLNREVILINQDSLGIQGRRLTPKGTFEVWSRPLNNSDVAVALLSKCDNCGIPMYVNATWDLLGFSKVAYHCRDVFSHQDLGLFTQQISLRVEEHGVRLIRCSPTE
jgi:alpha-N-acetylgalactosaminidase